MNIKKSKDIENNENFITELRLLKVKILMN